MLKQAFLAAAAAAIITGCSNETASETSASDEPAEKAAPSNSDILDSVLAGDHRSEEERARDQFRNPKETLLFFGVEPDMTVVEIWPGGGWYTNVIAPYLAKGEGTYYAAHFNPNRSERAAAAISAFKEKYGADPETYGDVTVTTLGADSDIAPEGSADVVLTFRNVHNWMGGDDTAVYFQKFYDALRPGGVLGVVEHRADSPEGEGSSGYVAEETVIAFATAAGFEFDQRSDINANEADTKDHPFGVWTLPPVRRSSAVRGQEDPDFDRAKYDAIGESDRMTLKFRKPIAADGALLE